MSILTVILASTREQAMAERPPDRPGWARQESIEEYEVTETSTCSKCGCVTIDQSRQRKQWRLSVQDTRG